ncbi:4182_t:CDS:1 [Paraglomus occultum]|uniref:4182_t:CDS:1 n=1 Tax=Paraglomus occultum TaxID=144539 RepID=A0A9N9FTA5_9GLOM|nr:4182_t:CDS:1 [Paraglomus occultum]
MKKFIVVLRQSSLYSLPKNTNYFNYYSNAIHRYFSNTTYNARKLRQEESELYLRLIKSFREKLASKPQKPEDLYSSMIDFSVLGPLTREHATLHNAIFRKIRDLKESAGIEEWRAFYEEARDNGLDSINLYNNILKGLIKNKAYKVAEDMYKDMRHHGILPNCRTLTLLLKINTNNDKGTEYYEEIERLGLKPIGLNDINVILEHLIVQNRTNNVERVWKSLTSGNTVESLGIDISPDKYSYLLYLRYSLKIKDVNKAIDVVKVLVDKEYKISLNFFTQLASFFTLNGHPEEIRQAIKLVKREDIAELKNLFPRICNLMIIDHMKNQNWNGVWDVAKIRKLLEFHTKQMEDNYAAIDAHKNVELNSVGQKVEEMINCLWEEADVEKQTLETEQEYAEKKLSEIGIIPKVN